eukprot:4102705-Lingulodinium_polyedra.AAC.1
MGARRAFNEHAIDISNKRTNNIQQNPGNTQDTFNRHSMTLNAHATITLCAFNGHPIASHEHSMNIR